MLSHRNEIHDRVEKADNADCNAAADEATRTVTGKADQVWEQTARAGADTACQDTEVAGTPMEGGLNTSSLTLEHLADQFMQVLSLNGPHTEELAQRWSEKVQALAQASTLHGRGMQKDPQEVFGLVQDRLTKDIEAVMAILSSRLVQDCVADQSDPVRQRLEEMVDANRRMGEVMIRIAEQMGQGSRINPIYPYAGSTGASQVSSFAGFSRIREPRPLRN